MDELYDLETDPFEMKNLIADPSARTSLKLLQSRLAQLAQ